MLKSSLALVAAAALLGPAGLAQAAPVGPVAHINVTTAPDLADQKIISDRDARMLADDLKQTVEKQLAKSHQLSDRGGALDLQIVAAKPTRPTFTQLSSNVSLSPLSFSLGGMRVKGTYTSSSGQVTPIDYHYEPPTIEDARFGWTWQDAEDGFNRFAWSLSRG